MIVPVVKRPEAQRLDAVQWLVPPGSFPVRQDLILAKPGPLPNELQRPRLETSGKNFAIHRYRGAPTRVTGGHRPVVVIFWLLAESAGRLAR